MRLKGHEIAHPERHDEKGRCPHCIKTMCMGYGICTCPNDLRPDCMKCHGNFYCRKHYRPTTSWTLWETAWKEPKREGKRRRLYWTPVITVKQEDRFYPRPRAVLNEYLKQYAWKGKANWRRDHIRILPEGQTPRGKPVWRR